VFGELLIQPWSGEACSRLPPDKGHNHMVLGPRASG
jgi:hypothetical protein